MQNIKHLIKKIAVSALVLTLTFGVLVGSTFGATSSGGLGVSNSAANDTQVQGYSNGPSSGGDGKSSVKGVASDVLGCSAGQLLSSVIQSGFNSLLGSLGGQLSSQTQQLVPIDTQYTELEKAKIQENSAHTLQSVKGVPYGASWDAMAWCIVNSIISDIADKTIQWANSGFNGKPAFLQNPERFFDGLADKEAAQFINGLAYGAAGINLCQPFKLQVALGVSQAYGGSYLGGAGGYGGAGGSQDAYAAYGKQASCSMSQIQSNLQNIGKNSISVNGGGGRSLNGYWSSWNQLRRDENNAWGSYMNAGDFLSAQITRQQNTAQLELNMNKGWLNFKKCSDPKDTRSCNTYTPGSLVESSLEKSLGIPKDRLVSVQKFDQVITAVVNSLIKVALDKVLEGGKDGEDKDK